MTVFEAESIGVRYGAVRAVKNVDIVLTRGQIHGVIGPNGAGKSTFIDALSGRRKPTSGTVRFNGQDITQKTPQWRRHLGVSRSFQKTSIFPSMTVEAQLNMVAAKHGESELDSIIDHLNLGSVRSLRSGDIAYGIQRSVDLALAMIGRPQVLLLDEPCAGLTTDESVEMLSHIRKLCIEREMAVLLVEHDVDGVFQTCDQVTVLDLGEVLASGDPLAVRKNPDVVRAYLGSAA